MSTASSIMAPSEEGSGQVRGRDAEGKRLDVFIKMVEGATLAILILALISLFVVLIHPESV